MTPGVRFVANKRVRDLLGTDERMGIALRLVAEQIAELARSVAPVQRIMRDGQEIEDWTHGGGHYRDMIEVDVGRAGASGRGRYRARVNAHKFTSHWIEFGTVKMRAFAPLRRAAFGSGLRFRPTRRTIKKPTPLK